MSLGNRFRVNVMISIAIVYANESVNTSLKFGLGTPSSFFKLANITQLSS